MNPIRRYRQVDDEVRKAAIAAARTLMDDAGWTRTRAAREVASGIAVHPNTVANWIRDDTPDLPSTVPALQEQVRRLQAMLEVSQTMMRKLVDDRHGPVDGIRL